MAPDDKFRLKVYEALLPAYRQLGEIDKFVEACDFLIAKSPTAVRSNPSPAALCWGSSSNAASSTSGRPLRRRPEEGSAGPHGPVRAERTVQPAKPNPSRAAELIERLAKIDQNSDQPANVLQSANLAMQYVKAKKYREGAELYETIAPMDQTLAAWHWKDAAAAWLLLGQKDKALAAAKKSDESPPEQRNDLLAHFWHRNLADVFLATGQAKLAIPHYEQAIQKTDIRAI